MSRRRADVEETRQRIIEATFVAHGEHGIAPTNWEDLARRAGVSAATVYRHFPTLDELVPACGGHTFAVIDLPPADLDIYEGTTRVEDRLRILVQTLVGGYKRGNAPFRNMYGEAHLMPFLAEAVRGFRQDITRRVRAALAPISPTRDQVRTVTALIEYPMWKSLVEQGYSGDQAGDVIARLAMCAIGGEMKGTRKGASSRRARPRAPSDEGKQQ